MLRFPAIHGNQIVFTYAGDLYTVPASGGVARRLTSDVGFEMFARFSPDGKWLAFTGQYDGNTEVYLMPSQGGVPTRLTWTATLARDDVSDRMGPNNLVIGWKDDGHILFRSRRTEWNDFLGQLYLANVSGGPVEELPLPRGGFGSYSPDGSQLVYNRVFREFRTWKRYRGGMADDVWLYDFKSKVTTNLTNNPALDVIPMWKGNKIYFVSDRDQPYRMNLYSYDLGTKQTRKLTSYTDFDVKFPSLGDNAIVFENGGGVYRFDVASERAGKVPITIAEDFDSGRPVVVDVSRSITNYEIAPDGSRALFGARGDVFTVPAKYGPTRNLTQTPGVHERNSKWSPDGRWVSYISDATGEDEVWIKPQDGQGAAVQLTKGSNNYKYQPVWSPDSRKILWSDRRQRLQFVDVETKVITPVTEAAAFEITEYVWAPDSKWLAYTKPEDDTMGRVFLYSLESKQTVPVTDGWFRVAQPAFSSDGKLLFFVSARSFNPTYGQTEFQHVYLDMSRIYFVTLAKDTKSPLAPRSDEVKIKEEPKPVEPKAAEPKAAESKPAEPEPSEAKKDAGLTVRVDVDGLISRIAVLPTPAANCRSLASVGSRLYYGRASTREPGALYVSDLDKQTETQIAAGSGYEISADGKKMLVGVNGRFAIIDAPAGRTEVRDFLDLSDMRVTVDRHAEWRQIYNESWRQMRDFFYAPNMHGVDWPAMRAKYAPLVDHVNHRADLTYVIKVAKATGGRVGYLHIPDMGAPGLNEFAKYFYPQVSKEALIVDVRSNGGGNVSPMIIERLRRELALVDIARNGTPQTNPGAMVVGPKVLLADEFSASDGDLVTWRFKAHRIGPVIGKRTWGGVVGIRGTLPLLDGGFLNKPEFSRYDVAGKAWVIEGVGVEPDIYVDNDPAKEYAGQDQQLDRAIKEILELLKKQPGTLPAPPPLPIKRRP